MSNQSSKYGLPLSWGDDEVPCEICGEVSYIGSVLGPSWCSITCKVVWDASHPMPALTSAPSRGFTITESK